MQGIGNLAADIVLIALLAAYGCTQSTADSFTDFCTTEDLNQIWRLVYGLGLIPVVGLVFGRFRYLEESEVWKNDKEMRKAKVEDQMEIGNGSNSEILSTGAKFKLLLKHYWPRLVGTALGWLVWDFAYYGSKGYNDTIVAAVLGDDSAKPSLWTKMMVTLEGQVIQCVGYYLAALVVDKPFVGRTRLQALGFGMIMIFQFISYAMYDTLTMPGNAGGFMALYFLSGFFQQFGPNTTTWLLPAELFPTEMRSFAHGISAGTGKFGAILSGVIFAYANNGAKVDAQVIFLLSGITGLIGVVLTLVFIPNVARLDLNEMDKRWTHICNGTTEEYTGEAVNPKFLSLWERLTGVGKRYDSSNK